MRRLLGVSLLALLIGGTGGALGSAKLGRVFTFRNFDSARAPTLDLTCSYDDGAYFNGPPFLLCGHNVRENIGSGTITAPLGIVVRITPLTVAIERYGENGREATLYKARR